MREASQFTLTLPLMISTGFTSEAGVPPRPFLKLFQRVCFDKIAV